jgi:hypothetical protein
MQMEQERLYRDANRLAGKGGNKLFAVLVSEAAIGAAATKYLVPSTSSQCVSWAWKFFCLMIISARSF